LNRSICFPFSTERFSFLSQFAVKLLWVGAPPAVKKWIASLPPWVEICTIGGTPDERLMALDPGERAAIMLALERQADLILIDDMEGRREAQRRDIRVAGTLAVLDQAAREGLINFAVVLQSLRETNFRLTDELASQLLRRHPSD